MISMSNSISTVSRATGHSFFKTIERLSITFTSNGKREFLPRDQVSSLLVVCCLLSVRNIPKFKDRANLSRATFQPMRRRACVYQQTNQNIAPVIKNFQKQRTESDRISHRFEVLRHIFKTFHEAYTIFLSGQRIGSDIGSVSRNIQHILWLILLLSFKQRDL